MSLAKTAGVGPLRLETDSSRRGRAADLQRLLAVKPAERERALLPRAPSRGAPEEEAVTARAP